MRLSLVFSLPLLFACGLGEDQLSKVGGGSSSGQSAWGGLNAKVFSTDRKKLYYAIITANHAFEPMNPPVTFLYNYTMNRGGTLSVNGQPILRAPGPRILALNPFGRMEEISISPAEADIVLQGKPEPIWEQVVLPHLAIIDGKTLDGLRTGHWIVSGKSGIKGYEGDYVDGKRDGLWKYYDSAGKPRATLSYRQGKLHGAMVDYDASGKETRRIEWKEDFPVGSPQTWQSLGLILTRTPGGAENACHY